MDGRGSRESADRRAGAQTFHLAALDELAREPELHRRHADYDGYEFFVLRRN